MSAVHGGRIVEAFAIGAAFTATSLALVALVPLARRRGWFLRQTRRAPQEGEDPPRPRVGGIALLLGLLAARAFDVRVASDGALEAWFAARAGIALDVDALSALLVAFAVGALDDVAPRGLAAGAKLAGQALAGVVLVWPSAALASDPRVAAAALALIALAVVAQNAINTFDNVDGVAAAVCALALGPCSPASGGALLGFWLQNAPLRGRGRALLGDGGSHLCGLWIAIEPRAWPVLVVPLLDLARVAWVRHRERRPIWRGDRAHLAHRLLEIGQSHLATMAWLVVAAVPSIVLGSRGVAEGRGWLVIHGALGSATLFAVLVRRAASHPRRRAGRRRA